jgi:Domain of unknown function (DUF6259)
MISLFAASPICSQESLAPTTASLMTLENPSFRLHIDSSTGAITSLLVKALNSDLIGEKRLAANFRISLPVKDYLANTIEGMEQTPISVDRETTGIIVQYSGMKTEKGTYPVDLRYEVELTGDQIRFRSRLTNHSPDPITEFWFPRIGGWTQVDADRNASLQSPGYGGINSHNAFFRHFPGVQGLGSEAAEFMQDYPGLCMPWWELHDPKSDHSLYLGYHDTTFRCSTWHAYLFPNVSGEPGNLFMTKEQAAGEPVGVVFSHVRYPYIRSGETFDSGEFIIRLHKGDWHTGSLYYGDWFRKHFPFDKTKNWLRKKSAWFTSIIFQPEDKIIADYETYNKWTQDAQQFGIDTYELIGWDKGGLERDYPEYIPEEKLGGRDGFRKLLKDIKSRGGSTLIFCNYNIIDSNSDLFREKLNKFAARDTYGYQWNGFSWGESTLLARKQVTARRHVMSSITPEFEELLESYLLPLVSDGAQAFQLDKVVLATFDFNPLSKAKPDVALYEGQVQAVGRLLEKCRKIDPEFCFASEALPDRFIPYVDVFYRAAGGYSISPLRYVFPEWTSCNHISTPRDFNGVNGSVLTGAVICVEPQSYQASLADPKYRDLATYIRDVEKLRGELRELIFTGKYYDNLGTSITELVKDGDRFSPVSRTGQLITRMHGHAVKDQKAIVVANMSENDRWYNWEFQNKTVPDAVLHSPAEERKTVKSGIPLMIKGRGLHVLVQP